MSEKPETSQEPSKVTPLTTKPQIEKAQAEKVQVEKAHVEKLQLEKLQVEKAQVKTPAPSTKDESSDAVEKPTVPPVKLSLTIRDKAVLYATYMPFIKNGALFIPTTRDYQLGAPISMVLTLLEEPNEISVDGQVIWITPNGAQGNRSPGIGVQFIGETGIQLRNKIETVLAGSLKADRPTHTM